MWRGRQPRSHWPTFKSSEHLFIFYFWLHWVFVAVCGLSLVAASRGYSLVVLRLLTVVASLVLEQRL